MTIAAITEQLIDNATAHFQGQNTDAARRNLFRSIEGGAEESEIDKAARDFEAVFITQMLAHMFEGVPTNEVFGGGKGEEVFKTMLFDEYGKTISRAGGIGVAEHVKAQLLRLQDV